MKSVLFQSRGGVIVVFVLRVLGIAAGAAVIVHVVNNFTPVTLTVGFLAMFAIAGVTGFLNEKLEEARWQRGLHQEIRKKYLA